MKHSLIILGIFFIVFSGFALAQGLQDNSGQVNSTALIDAFDAQGNFKPEFQSQITIANQQFQQLPDVTKVLFGNERMQVEITLNNGQTETIGIITQNNGVQSITKRAIDNPTLRITTSENTIQGIAQSHNPLAAFASASTNGTLKITALAPSSQAKVAIVNAFSWITTIINALIYFVTGKIPNQ